MVWIDRSETKSAGQSYMSSHPEFTPTFSLYDNGDICWSDYHIPGKTGIPQSYIFDRDGRQRLQIYGASISKEELQAVVNELL